jgi:MFS family permease
LVLNTKCYKTRLLDGSDIGRKKPLYFGLSLYIIASLLCVFANSEWSLIAARVLQALGGCAVVIVVKQFHVI